MAESIETLRKRIEVLERKRLAERQPSRLSLLDLSVLSDEELDQLLKVAERCEGLPGPIVDVSLLNPDDRAVLKALGEKICQGQKDCKTRLIK